MPPTPELQLLKPYCFPSDQYGAHNGPESAGGTRQAHGSIREPSLPPGATRPASSGRLGQLLSSSWPETAASPPSLLEITASTASSEDPGL